MKKIKNEKFSSSCSVKLLKMKMKCWKEEKEEVLSSSERILFVNSISAELNELYENTNWIQLK
jgi:hypothetical protein